MRQVECHWFTECSHVSKEQIHRYTSLTIAIGDNERTVKCYPKLYNSLCINSPMGDLE